jgi:biopolymer transport protein ExbD
VKANLRARRMARNNRRLGKASTLSLVSLMDIFTIMLFFLLLNSGEVEVLQPDKNIRLPESLAERKPESMLLIKISSDEIEVGGKRVAQLATLESGEQIPELAQALQAFAASQPALTEQEAARGRAVTIMGDRAIPYHLLKRVMSTCAMNEFRDISLAVARIDQEAGEAPPTGGGGA